MNDAISLDLSGLSNLRSPGVPRFLDQAACRAIIDRLHVLGVVQGERLNIISRWLGDVRWGRNRISSAADWRTNTIDLGADGLCSLTMNQVDLTSLKAAAEQLRDVIDIMDSPGEPPVPWSRSQPYPETHVWSDASYVQSPEERSTLVAQAISTAERAGMLSAGYLSVEARGTAYWLKNGVFLYAPQTIAQCSLTVRDPQGTGSGWAGASSYDWARIDVAKLAASALDKCLRSRNPVKLEPGRYTTILEPQATYELLRQVIDGSPDRSGYMMLQTNENERPDRGHVPFTDAPTVFTYPLEDLLTPLSYGKTRLGQQVFDPRITIRSDPLDADLGTLPFDNEDGAAYVPVTWVEHGVLKTLSTGSEYAIGQLRLGPQPWSGAFRMEGSGPPVTVEEMISTTVRGLLVTRFWDVQILDEVSVQCTGVTRDGLWLIENGKINHPVQNFRWTASPMFAFNNVEQIGTPVPVFNPECPAIVPAIKVRDFSFTSVVDAV